MKRIKNPLLWVSVILLIMSISTVVYASAVVIEENNLNVRSGPGLEYEVIGQVHKDETYPQLSQEGDWVEIELKDYPGWVTKEYISTSTTSDAPETTPPALSDTERDVQTDQTITIKYDETNVRNGPSTSYDIIDSVSRGDTFETISLTDGWYKFKIENKQAYVPEWLIEVGTDVSINNDANLKNKTIVIDAGHGGIDVGAIGASGNYEKHYTMVTAKKLKTHLEMLGADVILTRATDYYMSLSGRATLSNAVMADAFISLHYNSTPEIPQASGLSSYFYSSKDKTLASTIQNELIKSTGIRDRGTHQESYQVLRENRRPAVLLELGFLSNITEEKNINSSVYQQKLAQGIINGLHEYFQSI